MSPRKEDLTKGTRIEWRLSVVDCVKDRKHFVLVPFVSLRIVVVETNESFLLTHLELCEGTGHLPTAFRVS